MVNIVQRVRVGLISVLSIVLLQIQSVAAIDVVPTPPPLAAGPFLITSYSFSGHSLRYVQIYNDDSDVASLDGWKVQTEWSDGLEGAVGIWQTTELHGLIEPGEHVVVANEEVVPTATFLYTLKDTANEPRLDVIRLIPPQGSGLLKVIATISIKDSGSSMTPRDDTTTPETFYFARDRSLVTGNYVSSFIASAAQPEEIENDMLYELPILSPLQIVELYPHAADCSPATDGPLCYDYIKLFNASTESVNLSDFRLRSGSVGQSSTSSNTAYARGTVPSGSYAVLAQNLTDSGSFVWIEDVYGLVSYADSTIEYPSASSREGYAWSYNPASGKWQWTHYPTPGDQPNSFGVGGAVNACDGVRLSEIAANYDPQFIEIYNASSKTVDISGCQLQTNRSETTSYVFAADTKLNVGAYLAIPIAQTELTLTKTTTGTVYLLNSDGSTEIDARSYENLDDATSLALVGGTWQQTFAVTPSSANQYQVYPPCEAGYSRNELTGRCNKDPEPTVLAPCGPGEYRNPETNRCRSIATTTSTLVPCDEGEYRNPETNRCKKIESSESTLQPCAEGYERNPDTNRCRKVLGASTSIPSADFPIEPVADTAKTFTAWWVLGGVLLLGLGYAGWEWRYEIVKSAKRLFGTIKK